MYFLLFFIAVIIIYMVSFKDDFSKEHMDKVIPAVALVAFFIVLLTVLSSLV